ncbi:MAG: ACT domain-containing protein [Clostridiales bacterium]|nr:ACT domain-containing protein [Clostridiales bacterium]
MAGLKYLLVNENILPEVYRRVVKAKKFLASGDAENASKAAKMAGISRSAYYKYKDGVFEYNPENADEIVTLSLILKDTKGVLSAVTNEIYLSGANVLSINQERPQNGIAKAEISILISETATCAVTVVEKLKNFICVKSADLNNK